VRAALTLAAVLIVLGGCASAPEAKAAPGTYKNPVSTPVEKPDPFVLHHTDGYYYGMHTAQEGGYVPVLYLYKSKSLVHLYDNANRKTIWRAPTSGWNSDNVWAPEIDQIDGVWYIYYSAGYRTGVLKNTSGDPWNTKWENGNDTGQLCRPNHEADWAIDGTVLVQNGKRYFLWSGFPIGNSGQSICIAEMPTPTSLGDRILMLSTPEYPWETQGADGITNVNEGPEVLQRNGKTFVIYSASFCMTQFYCLGQLTCAADADPMEPESWTKSPVPVFQKSAAQGLYAVGHCSFTTSPDGTEDWIVYHTMLGPEKGLPRMVALQKFGWKADGTPDFGIPSGKKKALPVPSGE